jgi:pimeloyl-ACP methyl ester carboxylesterase
VNPLYFGAADRALYGVYLPPKAKQARRSGVVLCYPMGQEYMRAHRAFRQLAMLLQRAGFHVLRFDYSGTGDSAGESDSGTMAQWAADIGTAIDELKDTAEVTRVSLVGLRLGAALAALAAAPRDDIDCVVLWDPIVRGDQYLRELRTSRVGDHSGVAEGGGGVLSIMGFPIPPALRGELERFSLLAVGAPAGSQRHVIVSRDLPEYAEAGAHQPPGIGRVSYEALLSEGSWNEVDQYGGALIPQRLIQGIVAYLVQESET